MKKEKIDKENGTLVDVIWTIVYGITSIVGLFILIKFIVNLF